MPHLISIIVPIYKVEKYLCRCIDSILAQSYSNTEIILVDDGSPDNCPTICDEYAQKDKRVSVIHKKNGGLSDARNAGINAAQGDFITFVDSDDWIAPTFIESLYDSILKAEADIAICEFSKESSYCIHKPDSTSYKSLTSKQALLELLQNQRTVFATAWCKLYKADFFKTIRYPVGKFHEDEFVTYKLYYAAKKICYIQQKLYYYFQRNDSIMATRHPQDVLDVLEQRYLFFKEKSEEKFFPFLLPPLCWHLLFIYNNEIQSGSWANAQKYLSSLRYYYSETRTVKINFFQRFFLLIFSRFPKLYLSYRRYSPIHLRKDQ